MVKSIDVPLGIPYISNFPVVYVTNVCTNQVLDIDYIDSAEGNPFSSFAMTSQTKRPEFESRCCSIEFPPA